MIVRNDSIKSSCNNGINLVQFLLIKDQYHANKDEIKIDFKNWSVIRLIG
jgi:hypothetical protein